MPPPLASHAVDTPASASRLRVAMIIQRFRPDFSGQGIQMEQLCRALAGLGVHPVIFSSTRGRPSEWEECNGYRIRRLRSDLLPGSHNRSGLWMPTFGARVLIELLRLGPFDIVHQHGLNDGVYGAYGFTRARRVPLIFEMTLMGVDDPQTVLQTGPLRLGARRHAYRHCDAYVAMSRAFVPSYTASPLPADRLHVIPQGVDTGRFRAPSPDARAAIRRDLGWGPLDPVLVFVGSLIERKGIDVLLAAWTMIHAQRKDARLLLVGRSDFPETSEEARFLEQHLSRLPLDARAAIRSVGLRDDPERFIGAADVFVFPSRREGFGSVIIEAMACGLPCIVASLPGITDFVFSSPVPSSQAGSNGDGIIVPQDDASAVASAALTLLGDRPRAAEIGAAGLRRVRDKFDFNEIVAPAYLRLYTDTIERRRR